MEHRFPAHLKKAYSRCQQMAFGHYENFPVASLLLSKSARPHVAALYAFARTADDFADEEKYKGRRLEEIDRWEKSLRNAMMGKSAPSILQAFAHTLKNFKIPLSLPLDLLRAFRMDAAFHRYSSWNALLYYCRHSANPVGRMVLIISGLRDEKLHRYSDYLCSGLQLINFWQDSAVDLGRNRIYYPRQELRKNGAREKEMLALRDSPQTRQLVKNAVDYTEDYFRQGYPLLERVQGRLQLELRATYQGGLVILNKIRRMDYNVLQHRPVLNGFDKLSIATRAIFGILQP